MRGGLAARAVGRLGAGIAARRKKVWDFYLNSQYGLPWWKKRAAAHGKPLSFPRMGVNKKGDGHGGLDNVYYVEQMHAFITDPDNNVLFHRYFDVNAGDGHHQLSPGCRTSRRNSRRRRCFGVCFVNQPSGRGRGGFLAPA